MTINTIIDGSNFAAQPVPSICKMRSAFPLWLGVSAFTGVLCDCVLRCLRLCHKAPPRLAAARCRYVCQYPPYQDRAALCIHLPDRASHEGDDDGNLGLRKIHRVAPTARFGHMTVVLPTALDYFLTFGVHFPHTFCTQLFYSMLSVFTMCYSRILQRAQV